MVHENISAGRNYEFFILPFFAMRRISNLKEKSFKTEKTVEKIFLLFLRKFEEFGLSMSCAVRRQEGCLHRVLRSSGERLAFRTWLHKKIITRCARRGTTTNR